MTKALPLLFLLLSSAFAFTQTTCIDNVDNNGNVCTNFSTAGHPYNPNQTVYYMDFEDGQANPPDFTGAVVPFGPYVNVDLPFDPLKMEGKVPTYGSNSTVMNYGTINSITVISGTPGKTSYTLQYTFSNLADDNYVWSGRFTIPFTIQGYSSCGGRAHRSCPLYATGEGVGELSATLTP